jgi:Bacterial Ig domain
LIRKIKTKWFRCLLSSTVICSSIIPLTEKSNAEAIQSISENSLYVTQFNNGEIWGNLQSSSAAERVIANMTTPSGTKKQFSTNYVNSSGVFKLDFNTQPNGTKVELIAIVTGDNRYNLIHMEPFTLNKNASRIPDAPSVFPVYENSTKIKGYAEAYSTIKVTINGQVIGEEITSETGYFEVPITKNAPGSILAVSATNTIGESRLEQLKVQKESDQIIIPMEVGSISEDNSGFSIETEPYTTVEIRKNNEIVRTIPAEENITGQQDIWYLRFDKDDEILVQSYDQNGNKSEPIVNKVKDNVKPFLLNLHRVTDETGEVSVISEPNAKIQIRKNDELITEGFTDNSGIISFTLPSNKKSSGEYLLTASDEAGNQAAILINVVDITPPKSLIIKDPIYVESAVITGETEPNATVELKKNGLIFKTAIANQEGYFEWDQLELAEGDSLQFTSIDQDGNRSDPVIRIVTAAPVPVAPNVDNITNNSTSVKGKADPHTWVECFRGSEKLAEGKASEDGYFTLNIPKQLEGIELTFRASQYGKTSLPTIIKVKDVIPPIISEINEVSDQHNAVTGKTEPKTMVEVNFNGIKLGTGKVNDSGTFIIPIPVQKAGTVLEIVAIDAAGNKSQKKLLTVIDKTAPHKPTVSLITNLSKTITGKAEPGTTINVKVGSKLIGTTIVASTGRYSTSISPQAIGTIIDITATDRALNTSYITRVTVKKVDTIPPPIPLVFKVNSKSSFVFGKAEPFSIVKIKIGSIQIGYGYANKSGTFRIRIKPRKTGTILNVTAEDMSKNVSKKREIIVK